MTGIRAELAVDRPADCPVAWASSESAEQVADVRWTDGNGGTLERFETPGDVDGEGIDRVFDYGDRSVYEFDRTDGSPCFCEAVEAHVGPVTDVVARDGTLRVTVHADDAAALRAVLRDVSDEFGDVSLESLVHAEDDGTGADLVSVDRSRLTDRQRTVLETASDMGYFAYPRDANATAVAAELGIDPSTFREHLNVAQRKLFEAVLES